MNPTRRSFIAASAAGLACAPALLAQSADLPPRSTAVQNLLAGKFAWKASAPLVSPALRQDDPCQSVKDPTVVYFEDRWHLFCTIRSKARTHQIEYLSFARWDQADAAERHILTINDGYYCAPQVFYFEPQKRWYLIHQVSDKTRPVELQPAYSTTSDLSKPGSWSKPKLLFAQHPTNIRQWIDFWVICDDSKAWLYFTSFDGQLWRADCPLDKFPGGFTRPVSALRHDIFEAAHVYRLRGMNKFLALIEAQDLQRRYYKAYIADSLGGAWEDLASSLRKPFAARSNVTQAEKWTDSISHGELLRVGYNQRLEVDPENLRFLFQGASEQETTGRAYGQIPWRLGILDPA